MPEPTTPPSQPTPPVQPTPPAQPVQPAAGDFNFDGSQARSKLASELERMFPGGVIPDGGRFNKEAELMRIAGRESSVAAATATPPGSTLNAPPPVPVAPVVAPVVPVAPVTPPTPPVQTPEEKAAAEKAAAAPEPTEEEKKAAAIKAAAEAGSKKPLTEAERDAAEKVMTPQAGTAFKNLRHDLKVAQDAVAAKERELAEYQTKVKEAIPSTEAEKLKASLKAAQDRLAIFDYKSTEEYQAQVAEPLTHVETELVSLATRYNVPEADLQAALNDADPNKRSDRLAELSSNFNRLDLNRFDKLISAREDYQGFGKQLEAQAADKLKNYSQSQQEAMQQAQEAAKADWTKALDSTYEDLSTKMPIFKPTGDAQFDADMSAAIQAAKSVDLTKVTNAELAAMVYRDRAFDLVLGLVTNLHNKNVELDTRVRQLSGTAVPAGGGNPTPIEQPAPQFTSIQDAIRTLPQVL